MKPILINILTRTSSRPIGFRNCHASILNQTYKNVRHFVTYENKKDLDYLKSESLTSVKVNRQSQRVDKSHLGYIHAPYNLYCNVLLDQVEDGWILFLDDDDNLLHNKVLEELTEVISSVDEDNLLIWRMRYPDGSILPPKQNMLSKQIAINKIGSCCFMFHSKHKNKVRWDEWKGSDFRFLNALSQHVPNQKWVDKVNIQINNFGDFGKQNDLKPIKNTMIYNKNWLWYLLPKYHTTVFGQKVFNVSFYKKLISRIVK